MIKSHLEGKEITGVKDAKYYREYLNSYKDVFEFYTYSLLSESLTALSTLNHSYYVTNNLTEYTIIDSYKSYLTRGRLFELANSFKLYKELPTDLDKSDYNVTSLMKCLLERGSNPLVLKEYLISSFIDSLMERVIYRLSTPGTSIIISPKYDMETITYLNKDIF